MMIENALTAYMQHRTRRILKLSAGKGDIRPPNPDPEKEYLLYIHVPFCHELCPYCSFNRIRFDRPMAAEYFSALSREIAGYRERGYSFRAIYVGGGTPTVMPEELARILETARSYWDIGDISAETNPDHLTPAVLSVLEDAGVKRLSVGVQSLSDRILRSVNRYDKYGSASDIIEKISAAKGIFETLNVDMIFNFPNQEAADLTRDIEILKDLSPDQITWYPLMASRSVRASMNRELGGSSYRRERELYRLIEESLSQSYGRSTAWCFTKRGGMIDEYVVDYDEYAGAGPGSFGYIGGTMYSNTFSVPEYIRIAGSGAMPVAGKRVFTRDERLRYDLLMKLFGGRFSLADAAEKYGPGVKRMLWKELLFFSLTGGASMDGETLTLRGPGFYYLVIMMREFFTGVNNFREAMAPKVDRQTVVE